MSWLMPNLSIRQIKYWQKLNSKISLQINQSSQMGKIINHSNSLTLNHFLQGTIKLNLPKASNNPTAKLKPIFGCILLLALLSSLSVGETTKIAFPKPSKNIIHQFTPQSIKPKCMVGFRKIQQTNNQPFPQTQIHIHETPYHQFTKNSWGKQLVYCKYYNKHSVLNGHITSKYSIDWKQCKLECCQPFEHDQCYFNLLSSKSSKLISTQIQAQNRPRMMQGSPNSQQSDQSFIRQQKPQQQSKQSSQLKSTAIENQEEVQSSDTGIQVLIVILACVFGVPFFLLLFFSIVSIVRMCRSSSEQNNVPSFGIVHRTTQEVIPPQVIHLEDYKMDQIGPFMINPKEQCSICLDDNANVRTFCRHHYHPKCIKSWFMKARNKCPVCMGYRPNPMKVYCKKCYIAIKLVVLNQTSNQAQLNQMNEIICQECKSDQNSVFSGIVKKEGQNIDKHQKNNQEIENKMANKKQNQNQREVDKKKQLRQTRVSQSS